LETETPEDARERLGRRTDTDGTEGVEREPDRERSG
jgi:hypothetical protein